MSLDANQIIKKCFDSTKNALRMSGIAGSLNGQITWDSGLGAITHILGPTDQELAISSNDGNSISLGIDELNVLTISGTPAGFSNTAVHPVDLDAIAGGADVDIDFTLAGGVINIVFSATDPLITNFAAVTAAEVIDVINDQTTDLVAYAAGAQVGVASAYAAQDWTLEVTGGTAAATLLFPNGVYYGLVVGTLMGQLKFGAGLGAMVSHIAGPDDQAFYISSAAGEDLWLRADGGNEYLVLNSTDSTIDSYNPLVFQSGMGAVQQIVGPPDQNFEIATGRDASYFGLHSMVLSIEDTYFYVFDSTQPYVISGNPTTYNLAAIAGGGAVDLTVSPDGGAVQTFTFAAGADFVNFAAATNDEIIAVINATASGFYAMDNGGNFVYLVLNSSGGTKRIRVTGGTANNAVNGLNFSVVAAYGTLNGYYAGQLEFSSGQISGLVNILGPSDNALVIEAAHDRNCSIGVDVTGSGHASMYAAAGTITCADDGAGITATAAANCTLGLSTSGTGHATLGTANNTLTVNDDAATGIVVSGHLHVGGLFVTDAAQVIETIVMQTGAANVITVAATDHFIGVDCSGAGKAVNLEAAATAGVGRVLIIKDQSGNAGANPITVTPSGAEKIDEAATYVINANYGSVTLVCTGTAGNEWACV